MRLQHRSGHAIIAALSALVAACSAGSPAAPETSAPAADVASSSSPPSSPLPPSPPSPPAAVLAGVDVFGSTKVAGADVLAVAGLTIGAPASQDDPAFLESLRAAEQRLRDRFGFAFVEVSPVTYFGGVNRGKTYVTIDLVDAGDEHRFTFAAAPTGTPPDPAGLVAAWNTFEETARGLLTRGELTTEVCRGAFHCVYGFDHPDLAPFEARFIAEVPGKLAELRAVLATAKHGSDRAAAAYLLAYGPDRAALVRALVPALQDRDVLVRNNAMRVLIYVERDAPTSVLPLAPVLAALTMPATIDRNKAAYALLYIVKHDPAKHRATILREVGDTLLTMAALTQPNNSDPAIEILTMLSGEAHGRDVAAWRAWMATARPRR